MLLALATITASVLVLRAIVRRSEGKAGGLVKGAAGYPKVWIDHGVDLSHAVGTLPCPSNPPAPPGMGYWTGPVTSAQTVWAVKNLNANPIGSVIEDVVDSVPIAARIEWHTLQAATGKTGCFKGLNLLRYLHDSTAHSGAYGENASALEPTVFVEVPHVGTFMQRPMAHVGGVNILHEVPWSRDQVAGEMLVRSLLS